MEPNKDPVIKSAVVRSLIAGSCGGMASILVCHPMDTIRTRLQTTSSSQFSGAIDCALKTINNEGAKALYKGLSVPFAAQAVYKAIMFSAYKGATTRLRPWTGNSGWTTFLAGSFAGGVNSFVVTPVELIRNRLMVQYHSTSSKPLYSGPIDCVRQVIQQDGVVGMWKGLTPTLLRDIPGVGVWYLSYELTRVALTPKGQSSANLPFWKLLIAGGMGGVAFWTVALPLDSVKSSIQTDTAKKYKGTLDCIRDKFKTGGISNFYRGWTVAFTRGIPGAAVTFATFQTVDKWLS